MTGLLSSCSRIAVNSPRVTDTTSTWDCVYFGEYWYNDTNGDGYVGLEDKKEKIRWRILNVCDINGDGKNDEALLVATKLVDYLPFSNYDGACHFFETTWEKCSLRNWLNNDFYNAAFTKKERLCIKERGIVTKSNTYEGQKTEETKDKVFLLSSNEIQEMNYGFEKFYTLTEHTSNGYVFEHEISQLLVFEDDVKSEDIRYWWLRSNPERGGAIDVVDSNGYYHKESISYDQEWVGVRPVIYVDISSINWSSAGTETAKRRKGQLAEEYATAPVNPVTPSIKQ